MATDSNAMQKTIASMNQYQQMGNTGAIAILQIKEAEQAFKAAVARLEKAKAGLNPGDTNVAIVQERIAQEFFSSSRRRNKLQ